MFDRPLAATLVLLSVACASMQPASAPRADILGVHLDMPRDAVRTTLANVGTLEREERKRQEVWTVRDPRYASLLIGYDAEWDVRYVTAVAKSDGAPVAYSDILDVSAADRRSAGETYTYTWKTGTPPYYVIAIGGPERLTYLSLKKDPAAEQEDQEEDP
jgi:hypothetical protein